MRRSPLLRRAAAGFTIIETVVVIVVTGIIFTLGALVLGKAFLSFALTRETTDVDWQGRVAMERMARELRRLRSASAADLAFTATSISFNDIDGNPRSFCLSGGTLLLSFDAPGGTCGATSPQTLADNIVTNGLNFYYFDNNGNVTASAANVFLITTTLQVSEGGVNESYRVTVQPRRF